MGDLCKASVFGLAMLLCTATTSPAQYQRTAQAKAEFCTGFFLFKKCSTKPVDAISQTQNGPVFRFGDRFGYIDRYDRSASRCQIENNVRFGDPKYHAHAKNWEGDLVYLGVPIRFFFDCREMDWFIN